VKKDKKTLAQIEIECIFALQTFFLSGSSSVGRA
jgi:hypothetical protein